MPRTLPLAGAQMGPVQCADSRARTLDRLIALLEEAARKGTGLIGGSSIVDANGRVVAQAATLADEVILAEIALGACHQGKGKMFDFATHRRPQWYRPIVDQVGSVPPPAEGHGGGRDPEMAAVFREVVSRVEWDQDGNPFRFERMENGAAARLVTPEGQILELGDEAWLNLMIAIGRVVPPAKPARRKAPSDPARPSAGQPWSSAQDVELTARWKAGETAKAISRQFGRSSGAIAARLVRLGLIEDRAEARLRMEGLTVPARSQAAAKSPGP